MVRSTPISGIFIHMERSVTQSKGYSSDWWGKSFSTQGVDITLNLKSMYLGERSAMAGVTRPAMVICQATGDLYK